MNHSYFDFDLPSKGKLYQGINLSEIKVRAFTGAEEALLSEMNERNSARKISEALGRCLQGIDIKDLTLGDELQLMVWHAINSYTDGFSTKVICEECLQSIEVEYNLADMTTIYLPDSFREPYPILLSDGRTVNCRLMRVRDELQLEKATFEGEESFLRTIAAYIVDPDKDIVEKADMVKKLHAKDSAKLRAFQESFRHGPDFTTFYTCPKCEGRGVFQAPFRLEHFFPHGNTLTKTFGVKI
jgi:hypothetical protein